MLQMQLQMNLKDRHEIYNMHILSQYAIYIYIFMLCHCVMRKYCEASAPPVCQFQYQGASALPRVAAPGG